VGLLVWGSEGPQVWAHPPTYRPTDLWYDHRFPPV
jgi:hypothetical protein